MIYGRRPILIKKPFLIMNILSFALNRIFPVFKHIGNFQSQPGISLMVNLVVEIEIFDMTETLFNLKVSKVILSKSSFMILSHNMKAHYYL